MTVKDHHRILGVSPGATEKQIKAAYRKMALKYHPDLNQSPDAQQKFQAINEAYETLTGQEGKSGASGSSYDDTMAREVYRKERERMQQHARARRAKKKREEEMFNRPEWHDPILLVKYMMHGFGLLFALAAIVWPIYMAIFVEVSSLAGTFFFLIAGMVLMIYIYQCRKKWFRLGKFKTSWKDVAGYIKMEPGRKTSDRCCYRSNSMAGGKPYRIELLKTVDIKIRSYGVLDHSAGFKNQTKRVVIPRSVRAHYFHKISSLVKVVSLLGCLIFFPVDSLMWRFFAGILAGGVISACMLAIARVRSKVTYLFTPGLILKSAFWIFAISQISILGPGFNIHTTGYVYLIVAGLLFLLDMVFDLVMGFFPFYRWLFRPVIKQGKVLDSLYKEGFQNYQELPVYSVLFPLFRWLF